MAVFVQEAILGHVAQLAGQRARKLGHVRAGILTHDRAHRIDMLIDQRMQVRSMSGVCSISRHRLSAVAATEG